MLSSRMYSLKSGLALEQAAQRMMELSFLEVLKKHLDVAPGDMV